MLGDQIGTITCTTTNKPLSTEGALPKFETTAEGAGTLAGAQVQSIAVYSCLLYTSPSPRDKRQSRMPSSA